MWPILGSRDDLHIWGCDCSGPVGDASQAASEDASVPFGLTILFDGVPFHGCTIPPLGSIVCPNVPRSVQTIEIRFAQGASQLALAFWDDECMAAHPVCPR
jgi:hypothetical protein